ncbi:MAG: ATP-binding cassette domain-containing protein [Rhodospirillales bacterium]|nr:ATP-binding cassette domain-containing protein [Rhodospirillales bacterium]
MSGNSNRSWLRSFLKPIKPVFREVLAMSFFVNILALAVPVFTLQVYDRVVFHAGISTLQGLILGMMIVLAFDYILRQSRSRIMQRVALRVDVEVGQRVFQKFTSLPLKTLETQTGAHWQSLFRDVDIVRNTLSGASAILMADLPFAILFLGVIFVVAPAIAWVLLVLLPLFVFIAWRSASVMSGANSEERETSQSRDSLIAEMIAGRTTIKALALDRAMRPQWEEKHADNIERAITRGGKADTFSNLGATLTTLTTICMTSIGAIAIIDQRLTMGGLIATNMLSGRLIGPLNQLVSQWRTYSSFKQAVERLGNFFDETSERQESEVKLEKPRGEIAAEMASFSYTEEGASVVDNVSIKIEQGGVTALVGRNGSGKTTLLKLLMGLYLPSSGRILLDGADISQFSRPELAAWMGYVPQQSVLFAGTIRDNIAHRVPEASDDEIVIAAKAAGIHEFIIDQPDGYASDIGEAGQRLSGGQRQRIAIARALVGDPPVLLLDEPSSSLDRQAEIDLRKTLEELSKRHTVIVVTHSPILLAVCRDLVALDRGRVALAGPASDILPRLFGAGAKPMARPAEDGEQKPAEKASDKPAEKPAEKAPEKKAEPKKSRKAAARKPKKDDEAATPLVSAVPTAGPDADEKRVEPSPLLKAIETPQAETKPMPRKSANEDEKVPRRSRKKDAPPTPAAAKTKPKQAAKKKRVEPSPLLQALEEQETQATTKPKISATSKARKSRPQRKSASRPKPPVPEAATMKPKSTKATPATAQKTAEPSPLLRAVEAQESQAKEAVRGSQTSKRRRIEKKRKAPDDTAVREVADQPAGKSRPILQVFPATRPPPATIAGDAPARRTKSNRPVLTVKQGGKKRTGTNGLAPPPDRDEMDDDE